MRYVEIRLNKTNVEVNSKTIEYLYHGTSDTRLHKILKKGLVEDKLPSLQKILNKRRATPWEPTFKTYFTKNFTDAIDYANRHANVTGGNDFIIVLVKLVMNQQDYGLDEDNAYYLLNTALHKILRIPEIQIDIDTIDTFDAFNYVPKEIILDIIISTFCKNINPRNKESFKIMCKNNLKIIRQCLNNYIKYIVKIDLDKKNIKTMSLIERGIINVQFKPFLLLLGRFLASNPISKTPSKSIATDSPIGYKKSKRIVGILRIPIHTENGIKVPQEGKILYNFEHGGDTLLTLYNRNKDFIKTILANPERMRTLKT